MIASKGNLLCKGSEFRRMIKDSLNNVYSCAEKSFAFLFPDMNVGAIKSGNEWAPTLLKPA